MKITIEKSCPKGKVQAPPSKSMAHRMLICAGLSDGESIVRNIKPSEDVLATLDCLCGMGASYTYEDDCVKIKGIKEKRETERELYCRESGSTLRFFIPLCMTTEGNSTLYGSETLLKRPLGVFEDICKKQKIRFENDGRKVFVSGKLKSGEYVVRGDISSQFITGLLFALPLLNGDSTIKILPPVESRSYINLTIDALRTFGVKTMWEDDFTISVAGNQHYCPREVTVEGDYSNAAFFGAMAALGNDVKVEGLKEDSLQGDRVYKELFRELERENSVIDISDCPDLGPVLFAVAAAKKGATFKGTDRLKIKESDRAAAMAQELGKFGATVNVGENVTTVSCTDFHQPAETLCGHNDHRIVMTLSVLLTLTGGSIVGAEAVSKSMPDFFEKLQQLGVTVHYETI